MKTIQWVGVAALLGWSTLQTFAIEGLQISVQCSNVCLTWPSIENETYIVQYRQSLTDTNGWQTLTASLASEAGTNRTVFVHSNVVLHPNCGSSGNSLLASGGQFDLAAARMLAVPPVPLAMPADGQGGAVPLALYPPGMNMTGFIIYDPMTDEWMTPTAYSTIASSLSSLQLNGPEPMDGGSGGGDGPTQEEQPETGFYRVVRNGIHLWGMTNGMVLSGTVQFPIEMSLNTTDEIAGVTFYANGQPLIGATAEGDGYHWVMNWDTLMMPNGNFDITAEVDFTTELDTTNSVPVTVTVNNPISFPNYFTRNYGDQMWVYAELTTPAADFQIDIYDQDTNYLGAFTGATSDGVISFTWDLTDGNGYTFDSTNFTGVFTVTSTSTAAPGRMQPMGSSTSTTATNFWAKEPAWYPYDKWVIAYGPFDTSGYVTSRQLLTMLGGPGGEYGGVIQTLDNYGLNGNLSPGNVAQSSAFALDGLTAKTNLLSYLASPQFRNFYFFGHGSPSAIGGINPGSRIDKYEIQKALGNFMRSPKPANYHPYRLVFIDGCSAGAADFCESFGIPAMTVDRAFFGGGTATWSRAFLGFKSWKNYDRSLWDWYALMIGGFFADWMNNLPLQQCVDNAVAGTHNAGMVKMDSSWVIYGATNLTHNLP